MQTHPDVMIIDTDRARARSLRRTLKEGDSRLTVEELSDVQGARDAILARRPNLVLLHSSFPCEEGDGTGLLGRIREDSRNVRTGVMLVLPVSGSMLLRSGYLEGQEALELADDLITTDYTGKTIQRIVVDYLDRRREPEVRPVEAEAVPVRSFTFTSKPV